ncbi:MAG: AAA family ATPase, partial [Bacteroidetes bacterium]|nr:AAA family ATPase [Candidatus Pullibacteroides excrementavium]
MHRTMLYPIGIQNFESLRQGDYVYVDKTDLIHQLASTGKYYFLSRPRRFGKSLLVSTMEAYFQGKKELFKGLAIENLEKDWTEYPVLHLDLSGVTYSDENVLNEKMESALSQWEQKYGIANTFTVDGIRFENIIKTAYEKTGKPVVILIDEYDKPLLDSAGNEALREAFRSRLQGFYSVMKSQDGKLRFGFLTGVTKLGKLSIFS